MLKIFKNNIFLKKSCKNKHKKETVGKAKKGKVVAGNAWKHRRSVCKTKIPNEYREKGIRCFVN